MKKTKKQSNAFYRFISYILLLFTVFTLSVLAYFNVLPNKYLIILCIIVLLLVLLLIYKLNHKANNFIKFICLLLSFLFIFAEVASSIYAFGTIDFLNKIFDTGYRSENYLIYVIDDNKYLKVNDLKDLNIGIIDSDNKASMEKVINKLNNKITFNKESYNNISSAIKDINDHKIDAIIINESLMNIYLEEHKDLNLKVIDNLEVITKNESEFKEVNVTKKPFVIYISGVDTTGKVNKSARSDVNILAIVNPKTGKILLINTPRDYYVTLESKGAKDKLTHAGIYGVNESAKTLGLLYDTDINYYVRVNFTSFVKIIDKLGGIDINVQKPDFRYNNGIDCGFNYICEQNSKREFGNSIIYIKSGKQNLNGEKALAYARNRYQYSGGDVDRGVHQQEIIKGILNKVTSPSILTNYNSLLKTISNGIITNIDQETITKLINYQLNKNIKWDIESIGVTGKDGYEVTYSLGNLKSYVLVPNEEDVNNVKEKIKEVMR